MHADALQTRARGANACTFGKGQCRKLHALQVDAIARQREFGEVEPLLVLDCRLRARAAERGARFDLLEQSRSYRLVGVDVLGKFDEFGVEMPGRITPKPTANDRFRPNPLRDWRQDLAGATQRFVERRVKESLGRFPALERLWT